MDNVSKCSALIGQLLAETGFDQAKAENSKLTQLDLAKLGLN